MNTCTHSEEVCAGVHVLLQSVCRGVMYFFRVCAGVHALLQSVCRCSCTSSECVPVFMYFFRVYAGGSCTSSECVPVFMHFFRVCSGVHVLLQSVCRCACTSSECVPVFMYFFRVCAGGACTSSECVPGGHVLLQSVCPGVMYFFRVDEVHDPPAHTLKKYMNTGTHSEEVHEPRHTL
jgi:hypothetical protein